LRGPAGRGGPGGAFAQEDPGSALRSPDTEGRTDLKRAPRMAGAAGAGLAVLVFGTGCSGDKAPVPRGAGVPSLAVATPARTSPSAVHPMPVVSPSADLPIAVPTVGTSADPHSTEIPFTGRAADRFGAANVAAAYHVALRAADAGFGNPSLLLNAKPRVVDFSYLDQYYTPIVLQHLHPVEQKIQAGTSTIDDLKIVAGVAAASFPSTTPGLTGRAPYVRNFVYGGAKTDVAVNASGQPILLMSFEFSVQYLGTINGKPVFYQLKHPETLGMVQTGDKTMPWRIDSYKAENKFAGPTADPV